MEYKKTFEAIRVSRPLGSADWMDRFDQAAREIFGPGMMNFADEAVSEREVVLLGRGTLAGLQIRTGLLEDLSQDMLLQSTGPEHMPKSFSYPASPRLTGELNIDGIGNPVNRQWALTAIVNAKNLKGERASARNRIEREARHQFLWPPGELKLSLAKITTDNYLDEEKLAELAIHLPSHIFLKRGRVEPVTIELYDNNSVMV